MDQQLVIFELANEQYGVNIAAVQGIIKMQPITSVPHAPSFVEGIINLRGKVLPVINLRQRFGIADGGVANADRRIIVVSMNGGEVGMEVDGVSEVLTVGEGVIEPPPAMITTVDSTFITGIARLDERLVILLDLGQVLSVNEKSELQALPMGG